jgi:hypothetical protein
MRNAPLLLHNLNNGKFDLAPIEGTRLVSVSAGHGALRGDVFNGGRIDASIHNLQRQIEGTHR